ncbi:hypothetical protein [Planctomycetes bacterium K23_9]|uniref:Uncharacterized protein n=1 Tax=Stieleria marina TaxID=1930275 RepID=A0A517NUJ5_9BACT|nr:hypothetical protein K239x_27820 [Planctomycetes bacterium K23_9]
MFLQKLSNAARHLQLSGFALLIALGASAVCCSDVRAQSGPPLANDEFRDVNRPLDSGKVTGSGEIFGFDDLRESMRLYDVYSVDTIATKMTYGLEIFDAMTGRWEVVSYGAPPNSSVLRVIDYSTAVEAGEFIVEHGEFLIMYRVIKIPPNEIDWRYEITFNTREQAQAYADLREQESNYTVLTKIESRNRLNFDSP